MPKASKRKAVESESSISPGPRPRPRKRSTKASVAEDVDGSVEDSDDVFGGSSQQFILQAKKALQRNGKAVVKKDGFAEMFKTEVEDKRRDLRDIVEGKVAEMVEKKRKGLTAVVRALHENLKSPSTMSELRGRSEQVMGMTRGLLQAYESVQGVVGGYESRLEVGKEWEGDCKSVQRLLETGKTVAENKVKRLLMEREELRRIGEEEEGVVGDKAIWEKVVGVEGREEEKEEKESWGIFAGRMERGFGRLVRGLSEDVEEREGLFVSEA